MSDKEILPASIAAFDDEVQGCKIHKRDIMISFISGNPTLPDITDVFLTDLQAKSLIGALNGKLIRNERRRKLREEQERLSGPKKAVPKHVSLGRRHA
jgi:hypothetical protein